MSRLAGRTSKDGTNLNAMGPCAHLIARIRLLLLALTAISLVSMPFTQYLWTWDRYLHGGQDFETGVLLILMALSLVLVLTRFGRQNLAGLLMACKRFSIDHAARLLSQARALASSVAVAFYVAPSDLPSYHLPLLI